VSSLEPSSERAKKEPEIPGSLHFGYSIRIKVGKGEGFWNSSDLVKVPYAYAKPLKFLAIRILSQPNRLRPLSRHPRAASGIQGLSYFPRISVGMLPSKRIEA
jgi:hypothetical protein